MVGASLGDDGGEWKEGVAGGVWCRGEGCERLERPGRKELASSPLVFLSALPRARKTPLPLSRVGVAFSLSLGALVQSGRGPRLCAFGLIGLGVESPGVGVAVLGAEGEEMESCRVATRRKVLVFFVILEVIVRRTSCGDEYQRASRV